MCPTGAAEFERAPGAIVCGVLKTVASKTIVLAPGVALASAIADRNMPWLSLSAVLLTVNIAGPDASSSSRDCPGRYRPCSNSSNPGRSRCRSPLRDRDRTITLAPERPNRLNPAVVRITAHFARRSMNRHAPKLSGRVGWRNLGPGWIGVEFGRPTGPVPTGADERTGRRSERHANG